MNEQLPIEIRAHHVYSTLVNLKMSEVESRRNLTKYGYTSNFIDFMRKRTNEIFSNPDQRFLIIADKPDFLCEFCMATSDLYKQNACFVSSAEKVEIARRKASKMIGPAFLEAITEENLPGDTDSARHYGINIGETYTAKELLDQFEH